MQEEIVKYVQQLETSYTDAIRDLRVIIEREKGKTKKVLANNTNIITERGQFESLFIECIEEVRKDICKRHLRDEICNRKGFQKLDKNSHEAN